MPANDAEGGDITLEELCRKGLAEWCQKLADLQISGTGYSRLDGAILCPACGKIHGRCAEAMYPFLRMAEEEEINGLDGWKKRQEDWIERAEKLFFWAESTVSQEDGSLLNDIDSGWTGITVFYVIQLSDCLCFHSSLLKEKTKKIWIERLKKAAEFLYYFDGLWDNNINYPIANALALYQCGMVLHEQKYIEKAAEFAAVSESIFTENGLLFGEGVPRLRKSPRGCQPVDIGYNLEETLPSMVLYGWESKNKKILDLAIKSLMAHLDFFLFDGGINNSFGTRNYKWSYWGSRTSDGCGLGYLLAARVLREKYPEESRRAAEAAEQNLHMLEVCTHEGLLCGGPHYTSAKQPPCVHHTFTHAKVLAGILDRRLEIECGKVQQSCSALNRTKTEPWEGLEKVKYYPELSSWLLSSKQIKACVTAYDWEYMPGGHVSGGTLSLLQHKEMGMLLCAGMGEYSLKEPNNMQVPDKVRQECLALRIETLIDGRIYSSIYEEQAEVTCHQEQDAVYLKAEGVLKDIDHNPSDSEELPYYFEYQFGEKKVQISAFFPKGKLILPFISKSEETIVVCQNAHHINCVKNGQEVILKLYGEAELPYGTNRIFNLIPGLQAVRMDIRPEEGANIARIQILW